MSQESAAPESHQIELLAPAGNWECAKAAVANGTDAIYFGLESGFNARARATNFQPAELPQLIEFLHWHGVCGYVTLNTLVFSDELEEVERLIHQIADAGTDAVLVQDLGLARLIRATAPDLAIHASTQMTLTSSQCIAAIEELGIERVVLARELSIREISKIRQQTDVPLEVFVHGALCVAYSGQCLTSESLGGRSANRGQCAQACRLPYELFCDDKHVDSGKQRYLLSPQDLAAYALVPELIAAGAISLKIEGRLKTPEYVANITRHYRQAIDSASVGKPVEFTPREIEEMELSFSRGFSPGWLNGCDHKMLVPATSSAKRGVLIGEVTHVDAGRKRLRIELCGRLKAGDGVVFEGDRIAGTEQGGRIFTIHQRRRRVTGEVSQGTVEVDFPKGAVNFEHLSPGLQAWKNDDPALTRTLRKTYAGELTPREREVTLCITARVGKPLFVRVVCDGLPPFQIESEKRLELATKHKLDHKTLEKQFSRLGGTGYRLGNLTATIHGEPMIPLSILGKLRRELVEKLDEQRKVHSTRQTTVTRTSQLAAVRREKRDPIAAPPGASQLIVMARSLDQLHAVLATPCETIYADFQDIRQYQKAVSLVHASNKQIYLATPRIQKPDEMGVFKALQKHQPNGFLVRNLSGLDFCRDHRIAAIADFSLNAANELTADWLLGRGAVRVTPAYDLNRDQLLELAKQGPADKFELVVHQHMPMFHMEHCVFCAMLSPGTNKTNCGRPCDHHVVELEDRVGKRHPLVADVGCRNTLFNNTPQSAADVVKPLQEMGVRHFRIELLNDSPDDIAKTISLYSQLIRDEIASEAVWKSLNAMNRVGVTQGTLEFDRDPLAII